MKIDDLKLRLYRWLAKHLSGERAERYARKVRRRTIRPPVVEGKNNVFELFRDGRPVTLAELIGIENTNIRIRGSNNRIRLHVDQLLAGRSSLNVDIDGNDNEIDFAEKVQGSWSITMIGGNNKFSVGFDTACGDVCATLHGNEVRIGAGCMISSAIEIWTDGHSLIDPETGRCLNVPKAPVIVGDKVWLGRKVTLMKGAQIPTGSIVGLGSIVTKAFDEPNVAIAGVPARIVKRGITWDGRRPVEYDRLWRSEHGEQAVD